MTTVPSDLDEASAPNSNSGAFYANSIFDRHSVPLRGDRTRLVQQVLGLEYRAAHRRVRGEAPFTFEEMAKLAGHFGETLPDVFSAALARSGETGTFLSASLRLACRFTLGRVVEKPAPGALVATKQGVEWIVTPGADAVGAPVYEARQVTLESKPSQGQRVAVLDDDADITDSVCQYLRRSGFTAEPFHSVPELSAAAAKAPFDAYVLDWLVGPVNVSQLISDLQHADEPSVVAVLTGQVDSGVAIASDIAEALATYDVLYFQKPVHLAILTAQLVRSLQALKA